MPGGESGRAGGLAGMDADVPWDDELDSVL